MAGKVEQICFRNIVPLIEQMGYEVVEVEYAKKADGKNLTFTIDSPNGVTLEDCEKVHRMVSDKLDELDPTGDESYILNVSSVGIDRPIKTRRDFERNEGHEVELKLYAQQDGKKLFVGTLKDFNDEEVVLVIDGEEKSFKRDKVASITPVIKF